MFGEQFIKDSKTKQLAPKNFVKSKNKLCVGTNSTVMYCRIGIVIYSL